MKRLLSVVLLIGFRLSAKAATVSPLTLTPIKSTVFTISQTDNLWFFNAPSPDGYSTTIALNTVGPTQGQFAWSVVNNPGAVNLENGSKSMTLSDTPAVQVLSAGKSSAPNDVGINFKYNGEDVGTYKFSVYTPASVEIVDPPGIEDIAINSLTDGTGYKTTVTFRILDQFETPIPKQLPLNESFGARMDDYTGNTWASPIPGSATGLLLQDKWQATEGILASLNPHPQVPQNPRLTTPVFHLPQYYSVGSLTVGDGQRIEQHTVQYYLDHARMFPLQ